MIYKFTTYVEVQVEGDFDPTKLSTAIDKFVMSHISKTINDYGGFPHSTNDILDSVASNVAKAAKVKKVKISLVPKSRVLSKIASHVK